MVTTSLPNYVTVQSELTAAALSLTPSELQGLIIGMLSGGLTIENDSWKPLLFDYTNEGQAWPEKPLMLANRLFGLAISELTDVTLSLSLLLPDDDALVEYADGVSEWVNHFISGIGLAGQGLTQLSSDTKEALTDLEEIARLGIDEDDDMQEQAILLEQVIDHIKVCVLTIHSELGQKQKIEPQPRLH